MSKEKKEERSEKKTILIFIAVLIACSVGGFLAGFGSALIEDMGGFDMIRENLGEWLSPVCAVLFYVSNVVFGILTAFYAGMVKKLHTDYLSDEDDELLLDKLEQVMNYPVLVTSIWMIVNVFFASAMFDVIFLSTFGTSHKDPLLISYLIVLIISYAICLLEQDAIVKLTKQLNPEKRGSIFDFRFNKVWENSCDEGQKQIIYRSGHAGFKNVNTTCVVLWIVSFILQSVMHTGVYPVLFISIIWFVNLISYIVKGMELERK